MKNKLTRYSIPEDYSSIIINGNEHKINPEVAQLIITLSKERDQYKNEALNAKLKLN